MNNNLGPQEGQNLNPTGTNVPLSQPVGGAPVTPVVPVPPAPPIESLTPEASAPVPPMPTPTIAPIQPLPGAEPVAPPPQVNVEPLPSIAPAPMPAPEPLAPPVPPVENLGPLGAPQVPEVAPIPVAPVTPVVPVPPVGGVEPVVPPTPPVEPGPVGDTIVPPVEDKPKGNKNLMFAIVGLVLVLAVAGGGLFAMKFLGNKDKTNNEDSETSNTTTTSKVNFNGYTFEIPETMNYNVNGNLLTLTSKDNKWATAIGVLAGAYNNLKENKNTIQTNFQGKGYTASVGDVKTYEGVEYLTYELTAAKNNVLAAYTRLSDNVVLYLSAASTSNQFDYGILEEITPIVSTVKENSASLGMELPEDDDVSNVVDNIQENNTKK